jgi:L-serine dehydratase
MNVFDIIGPVMIGPSSSHTAGAVRLGRVVNKLVDDRALKSVRIVLSGSFAKTYKGHGTDRAILAGIMGYKNDSPEIRDALEIATQRGIEYSIEKENIVGSHPNTARIFYTLEDGTEGVMQGASIGGGNIQVNRIGDLTVDFNGENHTILIMHRDKPGVIAHVTNMMHWEYADLNISNFRLSRSERGGDAIMTIELDNNPPDSLVEEIRKISDIDNVILIRRL